MEVVEFIQEFGWDKAKDAINHVAWCEGSFCTRLGHGCIKNDNHCCVDVADLKKYTDAYELILACGGINTVKQHIKDGNVFRFEEKPLMKQYVDLVEEVGERDE